MFCNLRLWSLKYFRILLLPHKEIHCLHYKNQQVNEVREIISVNSGNHSKHIIALCRHDAILINVEASGMKQYAVHNTVIKFRTHSIPFVPAITTVDITPVSVCHILWVDIWIFILQKIHEDVWLQHQKYRTCQSIIIWVLLFIALADNCNCMLKHTGNFPGVINTMKYSIDPPNYSWTYKSNAAKILYLRRNGDYYLPLNPFLCQIDPVQTGIMFFRSILILSSWCLCLGLP